MRIQDRTVATYEKLQGPTRPGKPRETGLTVMIDAGPSDWGWTGTTALEDLLEYACEFIDYAKIYAVNGLIFPVELIRKVNGIYRDYDVKPFCGGILFETAFHQNAVEDLITHLRKIGASGLEISENYLELTPDERKREIDRFQKAGFEVVFEFGRKEPTGALSLDYIGGIVEEAVGTGAVHVILEQSELDMLAEAAPAEFKKLPQQKWYKHVVVEPDPFRFPKQHIELIRDFGPDVSLCNVAPDQVIKLEQFRLGIGRAVQYSFLSDALKQKG